MNFHRTLLAIPAAVAIVVAYTGPALASTPSEQDAQPSTTSGEQVVLAWSGTLPGGANSDSDCTASADDSLNDHHKINLTIPTGFYDGHTLSADLVLEPDAPTADVALSVVTPDNGTQSADDGFVGSTERVSLTDPGTGTYDAIGCTFAGGPVTYHGKLVLTTDPQSGVPGGSGSGGVPAPTFHNYTSPEGIADDAGEPSIGVNWTTNTANGGTAMFKAILQTARVTFDDSTVPATATWKDVSAFTENKETLDPILDTDPANGRTWVSQLAGATSLEAFTDDDGTTWMQGDGGGPSGVDHQTLGYSPYPADAPLGAAPLTAYPNAVYYCSQYLAGAFCSRSDDGGLTFKGPFDVFGSADCGGLHGHLRGSPDGTVYLPNDSCDGHQGFAVSFDAGQTWDVRTVPESTPGLSDPSVDAGADNTVYFGYADGDNHPKIAVSTDHGQTFGTPVDVGAALGIENAVFPEVIAGDGDRAAFAFLGTPTGGNLQASDFGDSDQDGVYEGGEWHLYVSTTYDRGQSWTTVDATPDDPVQRGPICLGGVSCDSARNLLDFMDITTDGFGRVLVAYADGCTGACVTSTTVSDNPRTDDGVITRQAGGLSLFADKDPQSLPGKGKHKGHDKPGHGGSTPATAERRGAPGS